MSRGLRSGMLPLAFMVVVAATVLQSSAAGTSTKPFTASLAPLTVPAGSAATLTLTLANHSTQQTLGSADVNVPSGSSFAFALSNHSLYSLSPYVDWTQTTASVLALRNLNIAPGASLSGTLVVTPPCSSAGTTWNWYVQAKQSNDFNGPPGNDFSPTSQPSTTVSACTAATLAWGVQPASAGKNATITGTAYDAAGPAVTVRAVDSQGHTITGATGTVTLGLVSGSSCGGFSGTTASLSSGVATFGGLTSSVVASGCRLSGTATGYQSTPASGSFDVSLAGEACTASGCPTVSTQLDPHTQLDSSATGSSFVFLAVNPSQIPSSVTGSGGGCDGFRSVGAGVFDESDGGGSGTKTFRYYVDKTLIQKKYGSNSGQQFIPICAGGARVVNGHVVTCTAGVPGWIGKQIDPTTGKFTANYVAAKCDPGTGLWWGILASFQDYNSGAFNPATTPTVTGWNSNTTYRWFDIAVPSPWDWRAGS